MEYSTLKTDSDEKLTVQIGILNSLEVLKEVEFGIYLDGGDEGEILMPARYVPKGTKVGQRINAFIYRDSEDRLLATTEKPKIMVGQCAYLKVKSVDKVGAFLDWGLPKDLLVPFNQQSVRMQQGHSYVVYAYLDGRTGRIAASSKLNHFLNEAGDGYRVGQQVALMIVSRSDLGYKAVIDGTHLGLIFHAEATRPLKFGQKMKGYIKQIRPGDKRIDLALEEGRALTRKDLNRQILEYLRANQGVSRITDKSPPDQILQQFGVSKGNYKKALGALYKERKIRIEPDKVTLVE